MRSIVTHSDAGCSLYVKGPNGSAQRYSAKTKVWAGQNHNLAPS